MSTVDMPLLRYAQAIEGVVNLALKEEEETVRRLIEEQRDLGEFSEEFAFDPLHSSEAEHHTSILSGETFTDEELARAERLAHDAGMPTSVSPTQAARFLRLSGVGAASPIASQTASTKKVVAPGDEKQQLRGLVNKKVGRLNRVTETPHSHIHRRMNDRFGDRPETATVKTLMDRLDWLEERICEA